MTVKSELIGFNYLTAGELDELQKNLNTLFATPEGTVPGDRKFGLNRDCIDGPRPVAENKLTLEVIEKVDIYVPQVRVKDVIFSTDEAGNLKADFIMEPNDNYEEEEEDEELDSEDDE